MKKSFGKKTEIQKKYIRCLNGVIKCGFSFNQNVKQQIFHFPFYCQTN